jgi:phosphate-selective porin OprO/OprP
VANDSRYTRFSSAGGGQLPGYEEKRDNQYRVYQAMQEWAWQRRGLSFQQELHWKSIRDRRAGGKQDIYGGYVQAGWFPAERWRWLSEKLEFAVRAAYVNPDSVGSTGKQENQEYTVGANWFFNGHRNKLSFDVTYLTIEEDSSQKSETRYQLQWDLSI